MRGLLASLLISMTLYHHTWSADIFHISLIIGTLLLLEMHARDVWLLCWKSWLLLRWIVLPTLLLHLFFTPGEIIFIHLPIPMSIEGLQLGVQLALHLITIFILAMLLGRLFPISMWLQLIGKHDGIYHDLYPYLCLFPGINRDVRMLLRRSYRHWQTSPHKIRHLPATFFELLLTIRQRSQRCARQVWHAWEQQPLQRFADTHQLHTQRLPIITCLVVVSIGIEIGVSYL